MKKQITEIHKEKQMAEIQKQIRQPKFTKTVSYIKVLKAKVSQGISDVSYLYTTQLDSQFRNPQ